MIRYGKLLNEGVTASNAANFEVVTIGSTFEGVVITEEGDDIIDANGQTQKQVLRWANYKIVEWICEDGDAKDLACTAIINDAVAAYNAKYPGYEIPAETVLIW